MSAERGAVRVLDAHLYALQTLAQRGGGAASDDDGIVTVANVHPMSVLINVCARQDPSVPADEVLIRARAFFASRDRAEFEVVALVDRDEDLLAAAAEHGMNVYPGSEPLQLLDHRPSDPDGPLGDGLAVRWVTTPDDVQSIVAVTNDAHRAYGFPDDLFATIFAASETVLNPEIDAVLLERGGEPVATAQVQVRGDTAYVGWVAVVASAGRLGLGTIATRLVVQRGFDAGATAAVLAASPMGAPVYRRMGFEDVGGLSSAGAVVA